MSVSAGVLTPSLDVVKPYPLKMDRLPVLEVEHFTAGQAQTADPFSVYRNHLYVYPKSVKCDNIKSVKVYFIYDRRYSVDIAVRCHMLPMCQVVKDLSALCYTICSDV